MAKTRFTSPVMRMLQGSVDEPQTKDNQGNLRVVKSGPNAGQPNPQYFLAGGVPKNDPAWPAFWSQLVQQAALDFPALIPAANVPHIIAAGGPGASLGSLILHPLFSFKVMDGDGIDQNGKANSTKEGFAGHWVVRFGSAYPPRCFHAGRYAAHEQIQEKGAIKRGYYVRVNGTLEGNANAQRPGLYVNLDMVELSGYGPEIVSGPDAADAFGGSPAALPAGATAAPQTPVAAAAPPAAAYVPPVAAAAPPVAAAPYAGYMAPPAPLAAPAPVAAAPVPPVAPLSPSAPAAIVSPTNVMLPAAQGATYEQMIAAGWTDETLRAHGMMA